MSTKMLEVPLVARLSGTLTTLADIATAPKDAARETNFRGSIVAAFVLLLGLAYIGTLLERPVTEHVMQIAIAKSLAAHSTAGAQSSETSANLAHLYANVVPVIGLLLLALQQFVGAGLVTLAVLLFNGRANYTKILYIFVHTSVLTVGLAQLALGFIHLVRGPGGYDTPLSMQLAMPSLAWLVTLAPQAQVLLAALNPFSLWQVAIMSVWIAHVTRLAPPLACVAACVPVLAFTALASMYAGS